MQEMQPAHFEGSTVMERLSRVILVSMCIDYNKRPQERAHLMNAKTSLRARRARQSVCGGQIASLLPATPSARSFGSSSQRQFWFGRS